MTPRAARDSLERRLGGADGFLLVVSNVVGVGIFTTPGIVAGLVASPASYLSVWLVGGLFALLGARAYVDLGAARPRAGGEYLYLKEAWGPAMGFLAGWTSFVAGFSGAIAASAVGFAAYLVRLVPALSVPGVDLGPAGVLSGQALLALALLWTVTAAHMAGFRSGRVLQNGLAIACAAAVAALAVAGLVWGRTPGAAASIPPGAGDPGSWLLALIPVLFTYSGWNAAVYIAEELERPARDLGVGLLAGTVAVIALYLGLNLFYVRILGLSAMAEVVEVGDRASTAAFGALGARLLDPVILLALASSVSAMLVAAPRVYLAMARDGLAPDVLRSASPRTGVPARSVLAQAAWSTVLVVTATFEELVLYTGFAVVLFSGLAAAGLFRLRRRGEGRAPTRVGLFCAALFAAGCLLLVVNSILESPGPTGTGALLILAGLPLYFFFRRRQQAG